MALKLTFSLTRGRTLPEAILSVSLVKRWLSRHTVSWALCSCQSCLFSAEWCQNPSSDISVFVHGHYCRGSCQVKAEYSNAFLLITTLLFRAGLPLFAWGKSKYVASFSLFRSLLLFCSEVFELNTFIKYKSIKGNTYFVFIFL